MKTLVNFRDLGGAVTKEGLKVKPKRVLRSGEVVKLCDEDIKRLVQDYGLKQIIDFRSADEINEKPDDEIEGASYINIDIMSDSMKNGTSEKELMKHLNAQLADHYMKEITCQLVTTESARLGYQQFLRACLDNKEGAILFHCFAGKDRTGFAAALLLKALGVSNEEIMEDYLKTVEQRIEANQVIMDRARQQGLTEDQLEALGCLMSVKQEYLEAAFDVIEQEYDSFENYIKKGLGITEAELEQLKQNYLE